MSCCLMNNIPMYFKPLKSSVLPTSLGNILDLKENLFGIVRVQHKVVQHIICKKSCSNSFPKLTVRAPCWLELWIFRSISLEIDALWGKVWIGVKGHLLSVLMMWFTVFQQLVNHFLTNLLDTSTIVQFFNFAAVCFLSLLHKQDLLKHLVIKVDTKHYCQPKFE